MGAKWHQLNAQRKCRHAKAKRQQRNAGLRVLNALSFVREPNCRFNADVNASHCRRLTWALGLFKENALAAFRILACHWSSIFDGPAETSNAVRYRPSVHGLIGPSVLKAAGEQRCCAKVPCALALLGCPSKGGQRTAWRRQSATHLRQVGALSFGSPR